MIKITKRKEFGCPLCNRYDHKKEKVDMYNIITGKSEDSMTSGLTLYPTCLRELKRKIEEIEKKAKT